MGKEQKNYLRNFVRRNYKLLRLTILLILISTILEILIPVFTDIYIKKYSYQLDINKLYIGIAVLAFVLAIHLITSFFSIKYEKGLIIYLLNDLRREWVSYYLKKSAVSLKHTDKGVLLTKISYHFSLLQMGLSNSLFGFVRWLFLLIGLLVATFFIDYKLLIIVLIFIPINLVIFYIGYIISKYYVSQDQTLYSKILRFISDVFNEFPLIKLNHKEQDTIKHLDKMVDVDSYYRVRRDLWLKFGNKVIFASLALFVAIFYLIEIYYPFFEIKNSLQYVVYGIILALLIKLIYLSLHIGLFSFPLKLGSCICVSDKFPVKKFKSSSIQKFQKITFKANKVKLSKDSNYLKNVEYTFQKGERILFTGKAGSGKSTLGHIFSGVSPFNKGMPWIIKIDDERLFYKNFQTRMQNLYLIDPFFQTEGTIFDTFTSDIKSQKSSVFDLEKIVTKVHKYPELGFLFQYAKTLGKEFKKKDFSYAEIALLQMASCLVHEPDILVIDNLWLDLNHDNINTMLKKLSENLKNTIIICFASKENSNLEYDQTHTL